MKTTKAENRKSTLNAHYSALQNIATICGVNTPNGKKLSIQLWKLEQAAYKITLDYCNGDNDVTTENFQSKIEPIRQEVKKLFNNNLQGFFINSDARGTALKINDEQFKQYYFFTGLTRDWGGNGMLSPEID